MSPDPLLRSVDDLVSAPGDLPWDDVLAAVMARFDCAVGTVHLLDAGTGMLALAAQRGLPPPVLEKVGTIPIGKGMAGIAAERREPVQVCNLQADESGVVRPGAKLTRMEGSIACPMLAPHAGGVAELKGVLGIAKPVVYEFTADEVALLRLVADRLAEAT